MDGDLVKIAQLGVQKKLSKKVKDKQSKKATIYGLLKAKLY